MDNEITEANIEAARAVDIGAAHEAALAEDMALDILRRLDDTLARIRGINAESWWPHRVKVRRMNIYHEAVALTEEFTRYYRNGGYLPASKMLLVDNLAADIDELNMELKKTPRYTLRTGWEFEATGVGGDGDLAAPPWERVSDGSVNGEGYEFRLREPDGVVEGLASLLELLDKRKPVVDTSCGAHFHFSVVKHVGDKAGALSRVEMEQWATYVYAFAKIVEAEVFGCVPESRVDNRYCCRLALPNGDKLRKSIGRINGYKYSNNYRYQWVNFIELWRRNGIRTVEFRIMGNTVRAHYLAAGYVLWATIVKEALRVTICGPKNKDILPEAMSSIQAAMRFFRKAWEDKSDVNTAMVETAKLQMDLISEQTIIKG